MVRLLPNTLDPCKVSLRWPAYRV